MFGRYPTDILDVESRAGTGGKVLVAEHGGRVVGTVTYYPDAADEGFGWPAGWAGLRALGVEPRARGLGVGRALLEACLERALAAGAPVICLHTAEFMPAAVAIYEAAGFRRDPVHDFDAAGHLAPDGVRPVPILAYRLDLVPHHQERAFGAGVAVDQRQGGRLRRQLPPALRHRPRRPSARSTR